MYFSLIVGYFIQLDIQLRIGWVGGGVGGGVGYCLTPKA